MTEIERMEEDMREIDRGFICGACAHNGNGGNEPCLSCETPELKGFRWRGRKTEKAIEKIGEDAKYDPVSRPAHYTSGGIECIDAMAAAFGDEAVKDFCLCNAFKYLWRHKAKNGVEDLKKARWYLERLIGETKNDG